MGYGILDNLGTRCIRAVYRVEPKVLFYGILFASNQQKRILFMLRLSFVELQCASYFNVV